MFENVHYRTDTKSQFRNNISSAIGVKAVGAGEGTISAEFSGSSFTPPPKLNTQPFRFLAGKVFTSPTCQVGPSGTFLI